MRTIFNEKSELFKNMIKGKNIAVLGLGISNVPAIRFLSEYGANICGCDKRHEEDFDKNVLELLKKYCSKLIMGNDYLDHLDGYEMIIKSPGIKILTPQIQKAISNGIKVTSEMEIFVELCPCRIIGVTGSDGKTTTTTLIAEMLKRGGYKVHVGGNIGKPLLDKIDTINSDDMVVLELSSFQLQSMHVSPSIAVITNITPNHLDYHSDMEEYTEAKKNIFKFQNNDNCRLILNADNKITASIENEYKFGAEMFSRQKETNGAYFKDNDVYYKGKQILHISDIKIKGMHNVENYLAAICAVGPFVKDVDIKYVARNFGGVEHRMEFVRKIDEISFYNDSIGSSPTRTMAGLEAQPVGKMVLIAGGYDKHLSFEKLADKIVEKVNCVVLMGATAKKIENAILKSAGIKAKYPVVTVKDMESAVKTAYALAKGLKDDEEQEVSVIFSPACASFDMYKNFEERGKHFKSVVKELK